MFTNLAIVLGSQMNMFEKRELLRIFVSLNLRNMMMKHCQISCGFLPLMVIFPVVIHGLWISRTTRAGNSPLAGPLGEFVGSLGVGESHDAARERVSIQQNKSSSA